MTIHADSLIRCTRCVLPETYPGISFDDAGVCRYCQSYSSVFRAGKDELLKIVARHKESAVGQYDCLVGLSGGKDSSYLAYYAVKHLGLRVLAYTYDNGFMPEQTLTNIRNTVETLGIGHVLTRNDTVRLTAPHVLSSWLRNPRAGMISFLCAGCQPSFQTGVAQTAVHHNIRLIMTGGGEPQTTYPTFAERLLGVGETGGRVGNLAKMAGLVGELSRNPWYFASPRCVKVFLDDFCCRFAPRIPFFNRKIRHLDGAQVVELFRFIDYSEPMILRTISEELGWAKPAHSESAHRSDCTIHLIRQYLYNQTIGCTKTDDQLSCMIREDMLSRNEALDRLKKEDVFSDEFLSSMFGELGSTLPEVNEALARARCRRNGHRGARSAS